ncbi:MAG: cytochrome c biogenesis protein CcdA [Rikenellaceae bacterium]
MASVGIASAQQENITWEASLHSLDDENYELRLMADIDEGYHIYGFGEYEWVPATSVTFTLSNGVELSGGKTVTGDKKSYFDEVFSENVETFSGQMRITQPLKVDGGGEVNVVVEWMLCSDTTCSPPQEQEFTFQVGKASSGVASSGLWRLLIEAIIWGFAALLTPCVFPMIPMTVSFFLKGEGGVKRGRIAAVLYGLFIVLLYTLPIAAIILITRVVGGDAVTSDIFNWLATHWLPNIIFFVVFMLFAASFLGAFEITLPSSIVNKSDSRGGRESVVGILFLALTLVLVSFSCTGPIIGSVIIKSISGEFWTPILTMLVFSVAFALPFTLFALFPSMLKKLPKSGGWLNSVKVVLGFVEIALGLKFLSVADQTYHWGILNREVYLAIWIVTFTLLGLYLLGKLRFKHDSPAEYISVGRLALAIATLSFVVYLIPGMWGAPLKAVSGYLPPLHTQEFVIGQGVGSQGRSEVNSSGVKYGDMLHLPHNLDGFFDMEQARSYAKSVNKPMLVILTGHGCVNCREMESRVLSDAQVLDILRDDYVIVALYMDDKLTLDSSEWVTTSSGRTLKSLGRINAHYALEKYGVNAQPYYIIESADGLLLAPPRGYDLNIDSFINFLTLGIEAFNQVD